LAGVARQLPEHAQAEAEAFTELTRFWMRYTKEAQDLISRSEVAMKEYLFLSSQYDKKKVQYDATDPQKQVSLLPKLQEVANKAKEGQQLLTRMNQNLQKELARFNSEKSAAIKKPLFLPYKI